MMRLFTLAAVLCSTVAFSQDIPVSNNNNGTVYLTWGYHRDAYSRSTIRFKDGRTDDYDFTFYRAKAKDQVDVYDFWRTPLTVPQYVLNIGYISKKRNGWGIEFSWDHLKYVVRDNQLMHVKGQIREHYIDRDTVVTPGFVHFEHTNGNNYAMISVVKQINLISSRNGNHALSGIIKGGAGGLVPKTDSYILGNHNDGPFRLSGIVFGASVNLRYTIYKYFFLETSVKGAFADYTHAKLYEQGFARHTFFSLQGIGSAGISIPL
jgi:hypothetical protein